MAKKEKRTAPVQAPPGKREPVVRAADHDLPYMPPNEKPRFLLQRLDLEHDGSWSWGAADADTLRQILRFMGDMEKSTWAELALHTYSGKRSGTHQKHKQIPVENLCAEAQERLQQLRLPTVESLFEFRVGSVPRLWGFPRKAGFYVLWWDPDHQVYPVDRS